MNHKITIDFQNRKVVESQLDEECDAVYAASNIINKDILSNSPSSNKNKIFVHCAMGRSRSATVVIMFLMKKFNIPYQTAEKLVKSRREVVEVNSGFSSQLSLFEENSYEF